MQRDHVPCYHEGCGKANLAWEFALIVILALMDPVPCKVQLPVVHVDVSCDDIATFNPFAVLCSPLVA